jgi:cytochrome P450
MASPSTPRMKGLPIFGSLHRMRSDPLAFLSEARGMGPVVLLGRTAGGRKVYLVNCPELIDTIFSNRMGTYEIRRDSDVLRRLHGGALFMLLGEPWAKRRRLVRPAFAPAQLPVMAAEMLAPILRAKEQLLAASVGGTAVDVEAVMHDLVRKIIVKIMFGSETDDGDMLREAVEIGMTYRQNHRWALVPLPMWLPMPSNLRFRRIMSDLDQLIERIVASHRSAERELPNLLTLLFSARDPETGEGLTNAEVRDEVKAMFSMGYLTTAPSLSWALYLLMTNPKVEAELRAELAEVLGDRMPCYEDIERLPYTGSVVKESLRLYPPGWVSTRRVTTDTELGGHSIPAGSTVVVSQYTTHRDPVLWERPEEFDPGRFRTATPIRRLAYYPFGGGPRHCVGERISLMEMTLIIAALLQSLRFVLVPGRDVRPWPTAVLRSQSGIFAHVSST